MESAAPPRSFYAPLAHSHRLPFLTNLPSSPAKTHRPLQPLIARKIPSLSPIVASPPEPLRSHRTAAMAEASIRSEKPRHIVFKGEEELSKSLAKYTADLSEKFVRERGAFTVVLSGGSLIKSLRKLLEAPYVDSIEWARWHVFWVDERVVKKDHPDSNYKLAFDGFLSKVPIPPGHVYAINDALSPEGAANDYEACLRQLVKTEVLELSKDNGFPKFDLMLLGMGPDGHVASLFPGHPLVKESQRWVTFIEDSPKPPPQRITFTFPVINSSSYIAQVVCGSNKAAAVHNALGTEKTSDPLPAAMVTPRDGELTWFLDEAAASLLQDKASL